MGKWVEAARKKADAISAVGTMLTDEQANTVPALFMLWNSAKSYSVGDRVRYGDLLYKCNQAHTAQPNWTPSAAVSLWTRIGDPAAEWPEWVQPTGAQDAYALGAKASHNGLQWVSNTASNVWEPGVYGWTEEPV